MYSILEVKAVDVDLVTTWVHGEMSPPLPYHIRLLISLRLEVIRLIWDNFDYPL